MKSIELITYFIILLFILLGSAFSVYKKRHNITEFDYRRFKLQQFFVVVIVVGVLFLVRMLFINH